MLIRNIVGSLSMGARTNYYSGALYRSGGNKNEFGGGYPDVDIRLDVSRVVSTANEVRPNNFNLKIYIKL